MQMSLELVVLPVTDVDRAKRFYIEQCGFEADADLEHHARIVQLTPPGSGCSICIGPVVVEQMPVPATRLQLCVSDIEAAREELAGRGVEISEIQHFTDQGQQPGPGGPWNSFCFFNDPDGNGWAVQEVPADRANRPGG
jgi:catechol 2,3-dioxygenase-like lactoylglutathione lyase family enzyme